MHSAARCKYGSGPRTCHMMNNKLVHPYAFWGTLGNLLILWTNRDKSSLLCEFESRCWFARIPKLRFGGWIWVARKVDLSETQSKQNFGAWMRVLGKCQESDFGPNLHGQKKKVYVDPVYLKWQSQIKMMKKVCVEVYHYLSPLPAFPSVTCTHYSVVNLPPLLLIC